MRWECLVCRVRLLDLNRVLRDRGPHAVGQVPADRHVVRSERCCRRRWRSRQLRSEDRNLRGQRAVAIGVSGLYFVLVCTTLQNCRVDVRSFYNILSQDREGATEGAVRQDTVVDDRRPSIEVGWAPGHADLVGIRVSYTILEVNWRVCDLGGKNLNWIRGQRVTY